MIPSKWTTAAAYIVLCSSTGAAVASVQQKKPSKESNEIATPTSATSTSRRPLQSTTRRMMRQSLAAQKAVHDPIRSNSADDTFGSTAVTNNDSHRMQDFSLAQQMELLSQKKQKNGGETTTTHFEYLMMQPVEDKINFLPAIPGKSVPLAPVTTRVFWSILGSAGILALSSWLWDPASAHTLWKTVVGKKLGAALAVVWLPWVWAHPAQLALVDLVVLVQLARQPAAMPYLQEHVLPIVWKTAKAMVVAEIWSRGWKWFFTHLEQVHKSVLEQVAIDPVLEQAGEGSTSYRKDLLALGLLVWPTTTPPSWLVEAHSLVVGSIRKGVKSSIKKSIQETITTSFGVWRNVLQEQVVVAYQ